MQENIGRIDRIVRSVVSPGLIGLGVVLLRRGHTAYGAIATAVGAIVAESAVTRVCPLNGLLGIDTRSQEERLRDSSASLLHETELATSAFVAMDTESDAARLA